tara:strand:- start:1963 stop:2664 length:702 start_codon:yes stop_codon:yes gene_type:complete
MNTDGHIIAIGGGGFGRNPNEPIIENYILNLSDSQRPNITFFPTASAENSDYIVNFYTAFSSLNCNAKHVSLFKNTPNLESIISDSDIIYIGGGNTKSMLAVFKELGLDKLLLKAYKDGKILAGVSAGAICWFDQGITDSWEDGLRVLDCMQILKGVCCPHYDGEVDRKPSVEKFLKSNEIDACFCIEDGAAIHYQNNRFKTVVAFYQNKNAYEVKLNRGLIKETPLKKINIY